MTTRREDLARRMSAAAASRKDGGRPTGRTAVRTKKVRITTDLEPDEYKQLKRWVESAAETLNPDWPDLTQMQAIRAMIKATVTDDTVNAVVMELLRQGQG